MDTALQVHRLHFALTIIYHYLFPQLTIGLALFIVMLKTTALRTGNAHYNRAARFWTHIFAINFAMGVVTGIPIEFQFGTNWAAFAQAAGGVIGQTLAEDWPHDIPLLYYAYYIMVGLGTILTAVLAVATFLLWQRTLYAARWMLWILMLLLPFPYIANTAGWMTGELGRQPWAIYGLMRTSQGYSVNVSAGNALFSLLGFMGLYAALSVFVLFLVGRKIAQGPEPEGA
jgi:cytochrome bd-type quinol oxidase subunit 1